MNILITGNAGYIGSVLCKEAKDRGHTVIGIDVLQPKHNYTDIFIQDDIKNLSAIKPCMEHHIDAIFHLAASADVTNSVTRPALYYSNNIGATSYFIDGMLQRGWRGPVIFSSTAAVYGVTDAPCKEYEDINPPNAYGTSKLMCETFLNNIWKSHKIPVVTFRYFNVAGAYDDVGDHIESSHVIQRLCYSAIENKPFFMYGYDLDTRDGSCIRDYLHVRDVVSAHFHALEFIDNNPGYYTFNLGTKQGLSVKELAASFIKRSGKNIYIKPSTPRPGDPSKLVANPDLFINTTKFNYKYSDIDNIVDSAWSWYRRHYAV